MRDFVGRKLVSSFIKCNQMPLYLEQVYYQKDSHNHLKGIIMNCLPGKELCTFNDLTIQECHLIALETLNVLNYLKKLRLQFWDLQAKNVLYDQEQKQVFLTDIDSATPIDSDTVFFSSSELFQAYQKRGGTFDNYGYLYQLNLFLYSIYTFQFDSSDLQINSDYLDMLPFTSKGRELCKSLFQNPYHSIADHALLVDYIK